MSFVVFGLTEHLHERHTYHTFFTAVFFDMWTNFGLNIYEL